MRTPIQSLMRGVLRPKEGPYNVLTICTHERAESMLALTNHNFYAFAGNGHKTWNEKYNPIPPNYTLLRDKQLPFGIDFDCILSQSRLAHHQQLMEIANGMQLPFITLEHTFPYDSWGKRQKEVLKKMRGVQNVFISDASRRAWGFNEEDSVVIEHAIDTELFKPIGARKAVALSVANEWEARDLPLGFRFWQTAIRGLPFKVIGDNPGLSRPAKSVQELASEYANHAVFVNTSQISPIPMSLLEAMASGCIVISTATCQIPTIVKHGENGILCDSPDEMRAMIADVLARPEDYSFLGEAARQTILDRFNVERFVKEWNVVFDRAVNTPFLKRISI